jgi:hypothetical protein
MKWQAVARDRGVAKFCTLAPCGLGKVLLAIGLRPKSRRTLSRIFALLVPRVVYWPDPNLSDTPARDLAGGVRHPAWQTGPCDLAGGVGVKCHAPGFAWGTPNIPSGAKMILRVARSNTM